MNKMYRLPMDPAGCLRLLHGLDSKIKQGMFRPENEFHSSRESQMDSCKFSIWYENFNHCRSGSLDPMK